MSRSNNVFTGLHCFTWNVKAQTNGSLLIHESMYLPVYLYGYLPMYIIYIFIYLSIYLSRNVKAKTKDDLESTLMESASEKVQRTEFSSDLGLKFLVTEL